MKIRKPIQQGTALVPCRIKGQNSLKKIGSIAGKVLLALLLILLLLTVFGTAAYAAGLVDDTVAVSYTHLEYIQEELSELQSYFGSIEELCEHEDDIICHSGCDDMDVLGSKHT